MSFRKCDQRCATYEDRMKGRWRCQQSWVEGSKSNFQVHWDHERPASQQCFEEVNASASTVMILSFQDSLIPTSRYFIFGWHSQYNYSEILTGRVDFFSSSGRPRYTLKDAYNYSIVTCLTGILSGRSGAVIFVVLAELLEIDERWKKVPKVIKVLMRSWKWENWCRVRQKFLKTQW